MLLGEFGGKGKGASRKDAKQKFKGRKYGDKAADRHPQQ